VLGLAGWARSSWRPRNACRRNSAGPKYHPDENEMEERWHELENLPKRKYKYDFSSEKGWNCESVVSYITVGLPYPSQGEKYAFLKNLGILDRHGNLFASCKRR
jgi:hypothetical protein